MLQAFIAINPGTTVTVNSPPTLKNNYNSR